MILSCLPFLVIVQVVGTNQCSAGKDFKYCNMEREQCEREDRRTSVCMDEHVQCLKSIVEKQPECKTEVDKLVIDVRKAPSKIILSDERINEQLEQETMKFDGIYDEVKTSCFKKEEFKGRVNATVAKLENPSMVFSKKISPMMVMGEFQPDLDTIPKCNKSLIQMDAVLKDLDSASTEKLGIPYHQWHCGWEIADFGRVMLRRAASLSSFKAADEFNFCCAHRRDCYMNGKSNCDQEFVDCNQKIVDDTKISELNRKKIFRNYLEEIMNVTSDTASETAMKFELKFVKNSEKYVSSFDGFLPNVLNKTGNYVVLEKLSDQFTEYDKRMLSNVYKTCKDHWGAISFATYRANRCARDTDDEDVSLKCRPVLDEWILKVCPNTGDYQDKLEEWKMCLLRWWEALKYIADIIINITILVQLVWWLVNLKWERNEESISIRTLVVNFIAGRCGGRPEQRIVAENVPLMNVPTTQNTGDKKVQA